MKGRKPTRQNVVPLTGDGFAGHNHDERAAQLARRLKPKGLSREAARQWDVLAPPMCHATVDRLKPEYVPLFAQLCEVGARLKSLRATLMLYARQTEAKNARHPDDEHIGPEIYVTLTRNGEQRKTHPEVGQLNEVLRQYTMLCDRFGMNPSAARGLTNGGQGELPLDGAEFF